MRRARGIPVVLSATRRCSASAQGRIIDAGGVQASLPAGGSALVRLPHLLARPLPRPLEGDERVARRRVRAAGRTSTRSSTSKPLRRSRRTQSPCDRWNSTLWSPGHSTRCMPNAGRSSRSPAATPSCSGMQSISSERVDQENEPPAGAQQARRLGDPAVGIRPQAGAVLGDGEVEAGIAVGHRLGVAVQQRERRPRARPAGGARWPAAPRSCRCRPTRAPRRASHDETYAVPQPSSIASWPSRSSGSMPTSASGTPQMPHVGSSLPPRRARRRRRSCAAHPSHTARLRPTCSGRSLIESSSTLHRGQPRWATSRPAGSEEVEHRSVEHLGSLEVEAVAAAGDLHQLGARDLLGRAGRSRPARSGRSASPVMTRVGALIWRSRRRCPVSHDRRHLGQDRLHVEAVLQGAGEHLHQLRQLAVDELLVEDGRQQMLEEHRSGRAWHEVDLDLAVRAATEPPKFRRATLHLTLDAGIGLGIRAGEHQAADPPGCRSASSCAIMPPIDTPTTCARCTPRRRAARPRPAPCCPIEYGPAGLPLRPTPRLSKTMVR